MVVGPTATGKTAAGVLLAQQLNGEVVSADSMQIYKGMDIGTAKPDTVERGGVVHHMLDIVEPEERYSVGRYQQEAVACIEDILERGKLPVVVGGTGLYIRSLTHPYSFASLEGGGEVRRALEEELRQCGAQAMHARLETLDPARAAQLHVNDTRRVIRALEIITMTGNAVGREIENDVNKEVPWRCVMLGMDVPRGELYARIEERVDAMMSKGLLGEVEGLLKRGVPPDCTSMNGIGYRQLAEYLTGQSGRTLAETVSLIKQFSRNYAKRQFTWFNRDNIHWIPRYLYNILEYARSALYNPALLRYNQ